MTCEPDDAALVTRAAAGDEAAFAQLVRRHEQPLAALIRRLVGNPADAEDVLQETLVQAWRGIGGVRAPGNVRAWLLQVARNRCRDFLKSAQRRDWPTEACELEWHLNASGRAAGRAQERTDEVLSAVGEMPPGEREAIRLFYLQGLTIREIAARSRCPEGTIKRRLFTGRERLRALLGAAGREEM